MRPTLSNIGTATYGINKSLNKLLKLLSKSEYNISNREGLIRMLREEATPVGYEMSSFDVKNLCNNVPPDKTIDFISEKVYDEKKILINIPKTVLKNYHIFAPNSCISLSITISIHNVMNCNGFSIRTFTSKYLYGITRRRSNTNIKIMNLQLETIRQ